MAGDKTANTPEKVVTLIQSDSDGLSAKNTLQLQEQTLHNTGLNYEEIIYTSSQCEGMWH